MADSTLFIPDISGFTRFVKRTEIRHSQHIIEELINLIIKTGSKFFRVAEIEGDAVFFFRHEEKVPLEVLNDMAREIYEAFHRHLLNYEHRRICSCGACVTAAQLELKFVAHSGEITLANFSGDRNKPYGEAVIAAHRLLKTKIGHAEYVLLSEDYLSAPDEVVDFDGEGSYSDKELGEIGFKYMLINDWKKPLDLANDLSSQVDTRSDILATAQRVVPFDMDTLHSFISDFQYRHLWNEEADSILFDHSKINQIGEEHYCVVDGKDLHFDTIRPKVEEAQRSYGEVLKNPEPLKYFETNFIMTKVREDETKVELRMAAEFRWFWQKMMSRFIEKKFARKAAEILESISSALSDNLKQVA